MRLQSHLKFYQNRLDPLKEAMDADGKIDAAKLEAWIIKSQIDPNDSDNEELMSRYLII